MATTWVDFRQLKADVTIEQMLAHYGVHLRRISDGAAGALSASDTHFLAQPGQLRRQHRAQCVVVPLAVLHAGPRRTTRGQHSRSRRSHGELLDSRRGAPPPELVRRSTGTFHRATRVAP